MQFSNTLLLAGVAAASPLASDVFCQCPCAAPGAQVMPSSIVSVVQSLAQPTLPGVATGANSIPAPPTLPGVATVPNGIPSLPTVKPSLPGLGGAPLPGLGSLIPNGLTASGAASAGVTAPAGTASVSCTSMDVVISGLGDLTQMSANVDRLISGMKTPLDVFRLGPQIAAGLTNLATTSSNDLDATNKAPICTVSQSQQASLSATYHQFVLAQAALLKDTVAKKATFASTQLNTAVASALRGAQANFDSFSNALTAKAAGAAQSIAADKKNLDISFGAATNAYAST